MAAGIPAVATRVGGIVETGSPTLVEPGDPGALAEAILALLEDPAVQIAAGRAAAAERTAARTARRMLDAYEAALAQPKG
jgi:glycosyltransferase involved in cell wall biosynthesis